jgi:hypothetical protein
MKKYKIKEEHVFILKPEHRDDKLAKYKSRCQSELYLNNI